MAVPIFYSDSHYTTCEHIYIYSSEYKDQNDVKKKSECEITFYFKSS